MERPTALADATIFCHIDRHSDGVAIPVTQPSPSRTTRSSGPVNLPMVVLFRTSLGPCPASSGTYAPQAMTIGGPGLWTGRYPASTSVSLYTSPLKLVGPPDHSILRALIVSSKARARVLRDSPTSANSASTRSRGPVPKPTPSEVRPALITSRVASSCASVTKWCKCGCKIPVVSPMRRVTAATAASVTIGANRGLARTLSPTATKPNPASSA